MVKKRREMSMSCCLPNNDDRDAMTGWNTALVRRYEDPAQKASMDVPWSDVAMDYSG